MGTDDNESAYDSNSTYDDIEHSYLNLLVSVLCSSSTPVLMTFRIGPMKELALELLVRTNIVHLVAS